MSLAHAMMGIVNGTAPNCVSCLRYALGNPLTQALELLNSALRDDRRGLGRHFIQEQPCRSRLVELEPDVLDWLRGGAKTPKRNRPPFPARTARNYSGVNRSGC